MPPTYSGSASKTVTGTRFLLRRYAAVRPAGPAPMMATCMRLCNGTLRAMSGAIRVATSVCCLVVILSARTQSPQAPVASLDGPQVEEFVGPFQSWTNIRTAYGAAGDGVTNDTAAFERALAELGRSDRSSPVL